MLHIPHPVWQGREHIENLCRESTRKARQGLVSNAVNRGNDSIWGNDKSCTQIHARDRLKPGGSCCAPIGTMSRSFGDGMILFESTVHHRASDLEHQMCPSWRPTHLLLGVHPAMQQPLHRAFRDRRRDRLLATPGCRVIDDDIGLPAYIRFEVTQKSRHFQRD